MSVNTDVLGRQRGPAPNNEASLPVSDCMQYNSQSCCLPTSKDVDVRLYDYPGSSELKEPQVVDVSTL